jgi:hydrogenase nickel incorporation protein HypA/HybF
MIRTHHFAPGGPGHLHQAFRARTRRYSPHAISRAALSRERVRHLMHEMGLAAEVYRIAREAADSRGGGPLESVTIVVGDLAAVEPDLIDFAWQAMVAGTGDSEARLVVEWSPARQLCAECGEIAERAAGSWLRLCPRCSGPLAVRGGDELDVRRVSFSERPVALEG